ncbi:hypothetical protein FBU30_000558 [Linnemannia zychae]|nr:hypothetical protein FBU30_000558 [Linnemannia zychae]
MSRSPASSSARFKAALSRLLLPSRKEDQHYFPITTSTPCRASAVADTLTRTRPNAISSLEVASGGSHQVDLNRFSGSNIQQQQQQQQQLATQSPKKQKKLFHRRHPLLTIKTSSTAPPSVLSPLSPLSPFPSSNGVAAANAVIPIPTDPTAPACFPGMGPVDFALKSQQLQQFQPSSRRSSLTPSLTPSLTRATSSMSPTMASGRHLIPHHHHDLHLGGAMSCVSTAHDAMSSLPSALMLRRGSVESMMSLNSLGGSHSAHLLRRGSVESMMSLNSLHGRPSSQIFRRGSVESFNSPPSSLWNPHENQLRASSSEWTNDEQRRSSISARSMDEMEVVVTSFRNGGVHPFARPAAAVQHHPFTSNERESGESEEEVDMPATLKTHHSIGEAAAALAMMAPSIKAHLPQIEEKVATASSNMTKSSLGQEHDISTMFQVGQLPTPLSSPMA